jgi:hypothetical protein
VIAKLPPAIPLVEIRRLLGYPPGRAIPERVQSRLDVLVAEAPSLLEPRGALERFPLSDATAVQLPLPGPTGALSGFALGLVTIGPELESRAADAMRAGDATDALLLDAIGSAAAEAAADSLGDLLARMGTAEAGGAEDRPERGPTCRISPGYGGWPLAAQEAIFARLPHAAVGVQLLPTMLMVPRKSVTFALWFDPAGSVIAGLGGCSHCTLEGCPRRATG